MAKNILCGQRESEQSWKELLLDLLYAAISIQQSNLPA